MIKKTLITICATLILSSPVNASESSDKQASFKKDAYSFLDELKGMRSPLVKHSLSSSKKKKKDSSVQRLNVRADAIEEAAFTLGINAGTWYQTKMNKMKVTSLSKYLDANWQFDKLMLNEHRVVPPVIVHGERALTQDGRVLRIAKEVFIIKKQAYLSTTAPTWRSYLLSSVANKPDPSEINKILLPQNKAEIKSWEAYIQKGWDYGMVKSNKIIKLGVHRLHRDFMGMIRYLTLNKYGMISSPRMSRVNLGVTGGGDKMVVGDRLERLIVTPSLNVNTKDWSILSTSEKMIFGNE